MVYGVCSASRIQIEGPLRSSVDATTNGDTDDARVIDRLFRLLSTGVHNFAAEAPLDRHRTKSAVSRGMQYVRDAHIDWESNLWPIALGVALMRATWDANVQKQVHFPNLALGGSFLRSHGGPPFLYEDGDLHLFNGVVPAHKISRRQEYDECVEGGMWCLGQ